MTGGLCRGRGHSAGALQMPTGFCQGVWAGADPVTVRTTLLAGDEAPPGLRHDFVEAPDW